MGAASYSAGVCEGQHGLDVALRVIKPCRRRGIGTQLVSAIVSLAKQARYQALFTSDSSNQGPDGELFISAMGFQPRDRVTLFDLDPKRSRFLEPIKNRVEAAGKIPPGARIASLDEAPLEQVVRLQVSSVGGTTDTVRRMVEEGIERESMLPASVVLMIGDVVQGVLLIEVAASIAVINSIAVACPYRGGWANVFLKEAALQRVLSCGIQRVSFSSLGASRDTLKFATRCSARVAEVKTFYVLDLSSVPPS
jgi:N-acetylglutamate synthase-like GNAT family acetyltransferase